MFSKEEALQIKKDFWIAFAEEYEAVRHFTARHIKSRAVGG